MIFQGIAPSIRESDPEYFRFETRLYMQYIVSKFTEFNNALVQAFNKFGESMKKVAESMKYMTDVFNKLNT